MGFPNAQYVYHILPRTLMNSTQLQTIEEKRRRSAHFAPAKQKDPLFLRTGAAMLKVDTIYSYGPKYQFYVLGKPRLWNIESHLQPVRSGHSL